MEEEYANGWRTWAVFFFLIGSMLFGAGIVGAAVGGLIGGKIGYFWSGVGGGVTFLILNHIVAIDDEEMIDE